MRTGFEKQYAIFITDYRGYALKFANEAEMDGIWGPDYYSRQVYKDLMSLYNKAKEKINRNLPIQGNQSAFAKTLRMTEIYSF